MTGDTNSDPIWMFLGMRLRAHPWHGVVLGPHAPDKVNVYVEIVPSDTVKYELDKVSGLLRIDRPQLFSNVCPALYGLLPQTYCGERVAEYCATKAGLEGMKGDGDPLDICVLTEKGITHGDILVRAIPIGGLRLLDGDEADDKILAVLADDAAYGAFQEVGDLPKPVLERLQHYFLTYKNAPGSSRPATRLAGVYGRDEAHEVIRRSQEDYRVRFGALAARLSDAMRP
jgi:inorganic pyrophosphatase